MRLSSFALLAPLVCGLPSVEHQHQEQHHQEHHRQHEKWWQKPPVKTFKGQELPFKKIVAFGDDFTDNGSGSYAHGITGNEKTGAGKHMWGHNTFTDGLIAVSYLSHKLHIPISYDYAWGSSGGAATIGSVCENSVIAPDKKAGHAHYDGAVVPSARDQVRNYTETKKFTDNIHETLHFFWTGNNDMIASLGWSGRFTLCAKNKLCVPGQKRFMRKLLKCFEGSLTSLIKAGAVHILVPNVYPRELAPWTTLWISKTPGLIGNFGSVVDEFNGKLYRLVQRMNHKHGTNIMLYDVNKFIKTSLRNPSMVAGAKYPHTCVDGCTTKALADKSNWAAYWNHTVIHHEPDLFYWMTEIMPSTTVHRKIARDMRHFLRNRKY